MRMHRARPAALLLLVCLAIAAVAAACGSSASSWSGDGGMDATVYDTGTTSSSSGVHTLGQHDGGGGSVTQLSISPENATLTVPYGKQAPTLTFKATSLGKPVPAVFTIDLGQIAAIDPGTGVLTPFGKVGGVAHVTAQYGGVRATTSITVVISIVDNGAPAGLDAGGGAGGNGGVGGSGPGGAVTAAQQATLMGTPTADTGLAWLYPYDHTVWPQGLLAPLLQWNPGKVGDYDAVYIHIQESGFDYKGFFAKPATPFVNHPILQTPWDTLSYSNQGGPVTISLVFASGDKAYGPLTETWSIAQGALTGTVYYNSYGTALALNYCCTSAGAMFGGATLAIKHGATSPVLIAGASGSGSACRVCHSVAAGGSTLVTQHGDDYEQSSAYALTAGNAETVMPPLPEGSATVATYGFAAISPDGTFLFSNTGPLPATSFPSTSALYSIPSGAKITSTGLPATFSAATPVFSPDGTHLAFNTYGTDQVSLGSVDFVQSSKTFSNLQTLHTPPAGTTDIFPAFLPTNDAVIFEHETVKPSPVEFGATRDGARGELWWVDLKTHTAAALAQLNGVGYLPNYGTNHATDQTLQYEPTVNPVASGGYAWVVFTSRRLYGNVATQDPFLSDPRNYDPATAITTKKLWVAAIDLNAAPGTDPSHPAFYLPGQELHACNSRGYWVVDPCGKSGMSCLTGDECCTGYCVEADGGSVCGEVAKGCSMLSNKCAGTSDCCGASDGVQCIDGYCAMPTPR
jgi:hypothetical protein